MGGGMCNEKLIFFFGGGAISKRSKPNGLSGGLSNSWHLTYENIGTNINTRTRVSRRSFYIEFCRRFFAFPLKKNTRPDGARFIHGTSRVYYSGGGGGSSFLPRRPYALRPCKLDLITAARGRDVCSRSVNAGMPMVSGGRIW